MFATINKLMSLLTKATRPASQTINTNTATVGTTLMFPPTSRRNPTHGICIGVVQWFSTELGYGFIQHEKSADIFVHRHEIHGKGPRSLEPGQTVRFVLIETQKGLQARNVIVIQDTAERLAA